MTPEESHQHSLITLNHIAKLDDYLIGIKNICDMGAGRGLDSVWWATLESPEGRKYNFNVTSVELTPVGYTPIVGNMKWRIEDYNIVELPPQDIIWCHDAFQYSLNPVATLWRWHNLLRVDGLLLIEIPYKLSIDDHVDRLKVNATYDSGVYHVHTLGSLILQLASAGFDCRRAHFQMDREHGWIRAAVYRTESEPKQYNSWYDLKDADLLPECLDAPIHGFNRFQETDLVVEWIDRSVSILAV